MRAISSVTPTKVGNTLTGRRPPAQRQRRFCVITGALSAANQNLWIDAIKHRMASKISGLKLLTIRPGDDDRDKAFSETQVILKAPKPRS